MAAVVVALAAAQGGAADELEVRIPNPMVVMYEGGKECSTETNWCETLTLAGARNGAVSGQAVLLLKAPGAGRAAVMSDLKSASGDLIPAAQIEVRYALPTGGGGVRGRRLPAAWKAFDGLSSTPRETGTVHPVWITVNIPAKAAPGTYQGTLSVAGKGVPVRLSVEPWTLPDPTDYQTWTDFVQSPESVALRYGVPLWSEEHWALIGKSFEQMRKVGSKVLYLELIGHTNFGNEQSMVRWVCKGERPLQPPPEEWTGRWKEFLEQTSQKLATTEPLFEPDFSIADRYAALFLAKVGMPKVVVLTFYEAMVCGGQGRVVAEVAKGAPITILSPDGKTVSTGEGPSHNCPTVAYPNYPQETINFWKPVIDGMRERLGKRGVPESAIMLGMCGDMIPGKSDFSWWKSTFPGMRFVRESHGLSGQIGGMEVGYATIVYGSFPNRKELAAFTANPAARGHGWMPKNIRGENTPAAFPRDIHTFAFATQLTHGRLLGEMNILGRQKGFGRMNADFWPCLKNDKGELRHSISARYPDADWKQLNLRMEPYLYPGAQEIQGTVRFEMLREGVQVSEAVLFLDKAITDKTSRARLDEALAGKVNDLLMERYAQVVNFLEKYEGGDPDYPLSDWQARDRQLFALAEQVQRALAAPGAARPPSP
jgi:hypothetical protein